MCGAEIFLKNFFFCACRYQKCVYLCHRKTARCVSSAWLECRPVTAEVTGSNTSAEEKVNYTPPPPSQRDSGFDAGLMTKANEMLGMFNNVKDSRITLLNSIQPFLGSQRQQRLGGAIQLLKVINIISTIAPTFNRDAKG